MYFSDNHKKSVLSQKNWLYVLKEKKKNPKKVLIKDTIPPNI